MNFDALKNEWQQQHAPELNLQEHENTLAEKLKKTQRKLLVGNIISTLGLMVGLVGIGWAWIAMKEDNVPYFINLLLVSLLIIFSAGVLWSRLIFWKRPDFSLDSQTFIRKTLRRLKRTPRITRWFMPVYAVLLTALLTYHILNVAADGSPAFKFTALSITYLYVAVSTIWSIRHHRKKQRKEIEPLIRELETVLYRIEE